MAERVVITGMGIVNCLGRGVDAVLSALKAGRSGIVHCPDYAELGLRGQLAGRVPDPSPELVGRAAAKGMGRAALLAADAVQQALTDAGLTPDDCKSPRMGLLVGHGGPIQEVYQLCHQKADLKKSLTSFALPRAMASTVSANIASWLGVQGPCMTASAACASGAVAIAQARDWIAADKADRVIAGGVHWGSWEVDCLFDALRVLSTSNETPTTASRPFDASRNGLVPSSAAGFVVLERESLARERNAFVHGELLGSAINCDGADLVNPSGEGARRCIIAALADASVGSDDIDYINAHATSTPVGDQVEAAVVRSLFGDRPFVSSTKSMTGHEVAAAGATEAIYTLLMMRHGFVAPTINLVQVGEGCEGLRHVVGEARQASIRTAISNSFGFGGVNAVLVLKATP
jgi:3-oxoacyl-[acyl-carrier-protein] synthase-1